MLVRPSAIAAIKGVVPFAPILGLAREEARYSATPTWSLNIAARRGVMPALLRPLISAPLLSSSFMTETCPLVLATIKAVAPF